MSDIEIWTIIIALGLGTYLLRFSFLGIAGRRDLPPWMLRHLRYTAVAILPGMVAPLVLWPEATGGDPDLSRMAAALMTVAIGFVSRNMILGVLAGGVTLYSLLWLTGLPG